MITSTNRKQDQFSKEIGVIGKEEKEKPKYYQQHLISNTIDKGALIYDGILTAANSFSTFLLVFGMCTFKQSSMQRVTHDWNSLEKLMFCYKE